MARVKSFFWWCVEHHKDYKNTRLGELIADMKLDRANFPRSSDYEENELYLFHQGACAAAMDCFEELWKYYYFETRGMTWDSEAYEDGTVT